MNRKPWIALVSSLVLSGCAQPPQSAAPLPASTDDVAREIIQVTHMEEAPQQLARQYVLRLSQQYGRLVGDLPAFQQGPPEELTQKLRESFGRFAKRYEALTAQRVDAAKVTEEVLLPLYHQFYSEQELRELMIFYRSAVGKKLLEVSSQLNQQAVTQLIAKLETTLDSIKDEALKEERDTLTQSAAAPAAPETEPVPAPSAP